MRSSIVNRQSSIYRGFTLIELLVVMGVLGILATGLITIINPLAQFQKANDAKRKEDLSTIQKTLEQYYNDNGRYPPTSGSTNVAPCTGPYRVYPASGCLEWGVTNWAAYNITLPKDPASSRYYIYQTDVPGQQYWLFASLERGTNDPQKCKSDGTACTNVPASTYCGTGSQVCNYGVSSSNTSP